MRTEARLTPAHSAAIAAIVLTSLVIALLPSLPAAAEGGGAGSYAYRGDHPVVISEIAPGFLDRPAASFVELRNVSETPVDLSGWNLYRCNGEGLRAKRGTPDSDFAGVVLEAGETYVIARAGERPGGVDPDDVMSPSFAASGFGYVLEDPSQRIADQVAVYPTTPWMTTSECDPSGSIPNILDVMAGETYQRTGATPVDDGGFIIALGTPGSARIGMPVHPAPGGGVVIAEAAPSGPGGSGDDLVELRNDENRASSLDGWTLWRCTALGERSVATLQLRFTVEDRLSAGGRMVIVGPESSLPAATVDAVMPTSLADAGFGLQLRDAAGALVDEFAAAHHRDSACQSSELKLHAALDPVRGESYQRFEQVGATGADADQDGGMTFVVAPRTPGRPNAAVADALIDAIPADIGVVISEFATDPLDVAAIVRPHNFVELVNRSDRAVLIGGWRVWGCDPNGLRRSEPLAVFPFDAKLRPGEVAVVAAEGTAAAVDALAVYPAPLQFLGAGVLIDDGAQSIVDRVGAFHVNEMDESIEPRSPCTNGVSLVTFQPDRVLGESYARIDRTGVDLNDFITTRATPGTDPRANGAEASASAFAPRQDERATSRGMMRPRHAAEAETAVRTVATSLIRVAPVSEPPVPTRVVAGTTGPEAGIVWALEGEREVDIAESSDTGPSIGDAGLASADGWAYPALRMEYAELVGGTVQWEGVIGARHRALLSAWGEEEGRWIQIGEAVADSAGDVVVTGTTPPTRALLVQMLSQPRGEPGRGPDGALEPVDAIDATVVHLTDTQYLAEGYPEEYIRMTDWIAELAERRPVAAAIHTGDLVQSWVDPDQSSPRARIEFERASAAQQILQDAGVATTVLPGNHDTKRGIDTGLYNEYFGPDRFRGLPGYVAPIAPGDNSSSYSIVQAGAASLLILSIGYGYGERELAWAERVVAGYPEHNVIVATHEHLTPLTVLDAPRRATDNRWVSRADELWARVVAPYRHVVAVLAGHYHGLGAIVTPDAGGIAGHDVVELLADYQEFRTPSGERATGFLRLLQIDLAAGLLAVDTYSPRLAATAAYPYDALQFVRDNGDARRPANGRPWNIMASGLNDRYTVADDEFTIELALQYEKTITMSGITVG